MLLTGVGVIRIGLRVVFVTFAVAIFSIVALPHLLPPLGRTLLVVSHGHNLPSIPSGSLLIVSDNEPVVFAVGDTVTFRTADGDLAIDQVAAKADERGSGFRVMGYHSDSTGPVSIPDAAIVGKVDVAVPAAGTAMTMLASTGGAVSALVILGFLMLMIWLTEDAIAHATRVRRSPVTVVEPAH